MGLTTLRTGATAIGEDNILQTITDSILSSGILSKASGTTHFLIQAQATPDMTIKVKAGRAYIKGSPSNAYPIILDTDTSVAITANASGSPRIDAVILYIDKSASSDASATNVAKLAVIQGTTSAPADSAIQSSIGAANPFIRLANVTVTSGATSITSGNISDQRTIVRFQLSDLPIQNGAPVWNGWVPIDETLTFASTDSPSFQIYFSGDVTAKYYTGLKVKFTNNSVLFQGFITQVGSYDSGNNRTPVIVYGGTDYTVANSAITAPAISAIKAPQGFPLDPTKWTVIVKDTASRSQGSPASGTWYNLGGVNIVIPIGIWDVRVKAGATAALSSGGGIPYLITLSTANNNQSDADFTTYFQNRSSNVTSSGTAEVSKTLVLSSKTTYYLNTQILGGAPTADSIYNENDRCELVIRAICSYL